MAISRVRDFFFRHERQISALSIFAAFIFDSVTLVRVDFYLTQLVLFLYLFVVAGGIIVVQLREAGRAPRLSDTAYTWLLIAMQFSLGGLFGRFLIYYGRSGSIEVSWPFLALLLALLVGNEFAKKYYSRFLLLLSFFFLTLFCFLMFLVPILFGTMNAWIFLLSGALSLLCMYGYVRLLLRIFPERIRTIRKRIVSAVGAVFLFMNALYFANIIPPLPLALHESGIYHFVKKSGFQYEALRETDHRWFQFLHREFVLHISPGQPLYAYSAVFAPTRFGTSIVHVWERYSDERREWVEQSRVTFPIVGGQDRGYRGYTVKSNVNAGSWRVNIETVRGQTIGRIRFEVHEGVATDFEKEIL